MTDSEKLISLVLGNRADEAIARLEAGTYERSILRDIAPGELTVPLPLYMLTLINDIWFARDTFADFYMPTVERNRAGIRRMKSYWAARFGYAMETEPDMYMFRNEVPYFAAEDWDMEFLLDGDMEKLVHMGYNRDEVEMCCAILTYDKPVIDKHIAKGTNPDVYISGLYTPEIASEMSHDAYSGISTCYDTMTDVQDYGADRFFDEPEGGRILRYSTLDLQILIRGAAYVQLLNLLESCSRNH